MTNNYKNGKIYCISCVETDRIYIGSTAKIDLNKRFTNHEADYKRWMNRASHYVSSFEILQYPSAKIILLQMVPCNSKDELRVVEQEWINRMNHVCVNKNKAYTGIRAANKKEWKKQYNLKYNTENAEKLKSILFIIQRGKC